jgi:hypothetical protein
MIRVGMHLNKSIYAEIDTEKEMIVFGNIFFKREVALKEARIIKKRFLSKNSYVIELAGKKYVINTFGARLEGYLGF